MEDLFRVGLVIVMMTGSSMLAYAGVLGLQALKRRMDRTRPGDPASLQEIEELRARVEHLEELQGRMEELEERMDFSERVLAQPKKE